MSVPTGWTIRTEEDKTVIDTDAGLRVAFFPDGNLRVFSRGKVPHMTFPTPHSEGSSAHVVFLVPHEVIEEPDEPQHVEGNAGSH